MNSNYSPEFTYRNEYGQILRDGVIYDSELEENFRGILPSDANYKWELVEEKEEPCFELEGYDELSI